MSIPIDATGAFNGTDSDGCVYTGQVNIIDPAVNSYGSAAPPPPAACTTAPTAATRLWPTTRA